jgi:hypothetical protein
MRRYEFSLCVSPDAYLDYYRGRVRFVVVETTSGETLQFPAGALVRFVTNGGIAGQFVLTCAENNKFVDLQRARAT